jgi:hypothetical protein
MIWADVFFHLRDLAIAFAFAFPLGWDRNGMNGAPGFAPSL